jgi:hypothetical protein
VSLIVERRPHNVLRDSLRLAEEEEEADDDDEELLAVLDRSVEQDDEPELRCSLSI